MAIHNRLILKVLEKAQPIGDWQLFYPLNQLARFFCLIFVCPALQLIFQIRLGNFGLKLKPRHSVFHGRRFNIFSSDIDLSAVFEEEPGEYELKTLSEFEVQLRNCIPWLGEIEIYLKEEYDLRLDIQKREGVFIDWIWSLRKLSWQRSKQNIFHSEYHRQKQTRAVEALFVKLSYGEDGNIHAGVARFLKDYLKYNETMDSAPEFTAYSRFLQLSISTRNENKDTGFRNTLVLDPPVAALLCALLPDGDHFYPNNKLLLELRERPQIRSAYLAMIYFELFLNRSNLRSRGGASEDEKSWITELQNKIRELGNQVIMP